MRFAPHALTFTLAFALLGLDPMAAQAPKSIPPATPPAAGAQTKGGATPTKAGAPQTKTAAQPGVPAPWPTPEQLATRKRDAESRALFQAKEALEFTLTTDFKAIDRDRDPLSTKTFPGTITVTQADGKSVGKPVPVQVRGRGHSRRNPKICDFSPLRLEFTKENVAGTIFAGQSTLKLGTHCRSNAQFEQYVLREYTAYQIFNLLTPNSFRARLAKGTYVDATTQKPIVTRYALFTENDDDVAKRMEGRITDMKELRFRHIDAEYLLLMTTFEYLLGNTDVSIYSYHNVAIVETPANKRYSVPYDFDYSGLVNTTYAMFDKAIFHIQSVRDRVYRGPCRPVEELQAMFGRFKAVKPQIMALYDKEPAFSDASRNDAKGYLEQFFKMIDNPSEVKRVFVDQCVKEGMM